MKRLNLGSGTDIRKDWVNLDTAALEVVDVVHDINKLPLPFGESTIFSAKAFWSTSNTCHCYKNCIGY